MSRRAPPRRDILGLLTRAAPYGADSEPRTSESGCAITYDVLFSDPPNPARRRFGARREFLPPGDFIAEPLAGRRLHDSHPAGQLITPTGCRRKGAAGRYAERKRRTHTSRSSPAPAIAQVAGSGAKVLRTAASAASPMSSWPVVVGWLGISQNRYWFGLTASRSEERR